MKTYFKRLALPALPTPRHTPPRLAQHDETHSYLADVKHNLWVSLYRNTFKLSCNWQMVGSGFGFAAGVIETTAGVITANPVMIESGKWRMGANGVCALNAKLAHATIHYTEMTEDLYHRKVEIYRDIQKDPDLSAPIDMPRLDANADARAVEQALRKHDEDQRAHTDMLINEGLILTLKPNEVKFRTNRFLRYVFYDHFENRRNMVLGGAIGYQLGTGLYAWTSGASALLCVYPVRAAFTSMVYWHFKRLEALKEGRPVIGGKRTGPMIDRVLSYAAHKPATLSIPFEMLAAANYIAQTAGDVSAITHAGPVLGTVYILSAVSSAIFIKTSVLSLVAELDQGDGIDWKQKDDKSSQNTSPCRYKSIWRERVPTTALRRLVKRAFPEIPVDKRMKTKIRNLLGAKL